MKKIASIGLLLLFFFTCEKDLDVTTIETIEPDSIELLTTIAAGQIVGSPSDLGKDHSVRLHDALVQLIHQGNVLEETNTNGTGAFSFTEQSISQGAYLKASAPGFFPNIKKVATETSDGYFNLIPEYFDAFTASNLDDVEEVVSISGQLQPDNEGANTYFYFVNESDELIGNFLSENTLRFTVTTVANTPVFLYHQNSPSCPLYGPVALGSFTEDEDIGNVYTENNNDLKGQQITIKG
ncbi:MAG: hypothetical protein AAGJ93_14390, partial [Bacteroidota bacterium]